MAITPSYKVNKEGEEEYIDRPAVTTVQYNPEVDAKYQKAKRVVVNIDEMLAEQSKYFV